MRNDLDEVEFQRPLFGEFAQQIAPIPSAKLKECLVHQRAHGGRLGELLVQKGLLRPDQIHEVLGKMAEWVATSRNADMPDFGFPRPVFLSVCMPCYNEADVIEDCLRGACAILPHFVESFEIVVTDDGSQDRTGDIVEEISERDDRVVLVRHQENRGYGSAVTSGMQAAKGDLIMFTDGDGQFSMLDIPQLLAHIDEVDYVVGYRYKRVEGGMRQLNAWAWGRLIRLLLGVRVRDLDCAFKIFPRAVVERLRMTSEGACINAEIMAQLAHSQLTFCEVPVRHYPRYHGAPTGANLKVITKAFRELPQLWAYRSAPPLRIPEAPPGEKKPVAVPTQEETASASGP